MASAALDVRPITTPAERERWNDLAARSAVGHRHQCLWWMDPLERYGFQSTVLGCWIEDRLVGGALFRAYRVPFTFRSVSECLDGPIFLQWESDWAGRVLDAVESLATRSRSMAVIIRDCPHPAVHHDLTETLARRSHSLTSTPGSADAILRLEGRTLEQILASFNRGTRARIRKTQGGPLRVRRLSKPEDLASAYRAWIATANRKSFTDVRPWPGLEPVLRHCVDHGLGSVFATYLDDQLLAAVFVVHVGATAAYVYGGYMDGAQQHSPTHILQYEAIRECIDKGIPAYNFGMLISEGQATNRGVDDFKLGFGAEPQRHLDTIIWRRQRLLYGSIERIRGWSLGRKLEGLLRNKLIRRGDALSGVDR
jgi:hypothetical protein